MALQRTRRPRFRSGRSLRSLGSPLNARSLGAARSGGVSFLGLLLVFSTGCYKPRTPCVYEVPENFRGWVLIRFRRPECPPVPVENGRLVLRISETGVLCTSSSFETGWAKDQYYFVGKSRTPIPSTGWGGGGLVWLESNGECRDGANRPVAAFANFFVGTEAEAREPPRRPESPECL